MGRGRAKAKQTKVARELKYHSPNTDLAALQRELGGSSPGGRSDSDVDDEYDAYLDDEDDEDEDDDEASDGGDWAARRR
jgi:hypothetical protein